ncbi:MAG: hypothetical protein QOF60_534 [Actinomycetota bacterium]|jgi:glycosyltransferase involved in cell wall biosynthesis|nr:hypothetical protein [Actinomycetota bacterium]
MKVAFDATPLVGPGTGVATFTRGARSALSARPDIDLVDFAMTVRGRSETGMRWPMPAGLLQRVWAKAEVAPVEWWTGPVDVVHGTNFVVPPSRRRRAAAVVTVYDLTALRFPELCSPASLRYPDLVRAAVSRGAWVHVLARAIGDEVVERLGVPSERVRVVPSGVDPAVGGDAIAGRSLAGCDRYVLALGTVEPRKDLPSLVRAFDRLAASRPDLGLVVAGPDGWGTESFAGAVALARHGDRVRRLGWVDDSTRADLLAGAAALAVPSVYEGFGYPALEAMSAGTPVVASSAGSLPEVVGDAGVLVPPGDIDALTDALAGVIDGDPSEWRAKGMANAARFEWKACASGLVELYGDAITWT